MNKKFDVSGVTVATVVPFDEFGGINWADYRNLLEYCACAADGSIFVNGHAGERATLTRKERLQVIERTRDFIGEDRVLMAGVISYGAGDAVAQARDTLSAGSDIIVLFPSPLFAAGGAATSEVPLAFTRAVSDAVDAPLSIFQYPLSSGCGYTTETLAAMARIPNVVAIKEGSDTMTAYEDTWREVKAADPSVAILASNYEWLMLQLVVGADGILSGLASLVPHMLTDLWHSAKAENLSGMRAINDRLYPLIRAIYAKPRMDIHTRIKAGLKHLGIIGSAGSRSPLLPVTEAVAAAVAQAINQAGIDQ
ncbi:dihydrodipicolinate synthase family protein [Mesorhizobium sp.]|uniref:dihydrodipicolinate synthase family protein n=1 Tax=Mesorhizobium sp. TaxID=1871066 RepID=UPI000FE4BCA9|nr:dihydrodipicolinate synthase family protein [Mesorhizobium sp.]RWI88937.1 MAG: dihydrodipicolinate synthase family protein [Mesorhizobium sp.]